MLHLGGIRADWNDYHVSLEAQDSRVFRVHSGYRGDAHVFGSFADFTACESVPSSVEGATYIITANNDKMGTGSSFLSFSVNQNVTVYVAYDSRASSLPNWLAGWTATGLTVGTTDVSFDLYSKDYVAGSVTLGSNMAAGASGARSNYYVVITPK